MTIVCNYVRTTVSLKAIVRVIVIIILKVGASDYAAFIQVDAKKIEKIATRRYKIPNVSQDNITVRVLVFLMIICCKIKFGAKCDDKIWNQSPLGDVVVKSIL